MTLHSTDSQRRVCFGRAPTNDFTKEKAEEASAKQFPAHLQERVGVMNKHLHFVFRLVQTIGKCSCCWFINHSQNIQPSDLPSVFSSLKEKEEEL